MTDETIKDVKIKKKPGPKKLHPLEKKVQQYYLVKSKYANEVERRIEKMLREEYES